MGQCDAIITNATSQVRRGAEAREGLPAATAAMIYHAPLTSTDMGEGEQGAVVNPNIRASGAQPEPLPGSIAVAGTTVATPDAHAYVPPFASALKRVDLKVDEGGGAWSHLYRPSGSEAGICAYSVETDRGDDVHSLSVGTKCLQADVALAVDAAPTFTLTEQAQYITTWADAVIRASTNPATGDLRLRGNPSEWIDRADGEGGDAYLRLIDVAPNPVTGQTVATFYGISGRPGPLAGSWTVGAGTNIWTAPDGAADKIVGDVFYSDDEVLFVIATIVDKDNFTTVANHVAGAAGVTLTREYGAAVAARMVATEVRPGLNTLNKKNIWNEVAESSGGEMGDVLAGNIVEAHLTSVGGITPSVLGALTGTVSVAAGSDVVTGSGTDFVADVRLGDFVNTPLTLAAGRRVIEITSVTSMRVDKVYGSLESGVTMNLRPIPQIALTGTYTTAASDTIVGSGGNLTTLQVGAWFRTIGGEVRRLATITDNDNATVTRDFDNSEPGVAATTDLEWRVDRERSDWVTIEHPSNIFPVLRAEVFVFISTPASPEEKIGVESLAWSFIAGFLARFVGGSPWATGINPSGNSTGTVELLAPKDSVVFRKATAGQKRARIRVLMRTPVSIGTSGLPYSWEFFLHVKATGKALVIPDAATNQMRLAGTLHDDPDQTDGITDQMALRITSDEEFPLPEA